MTDHETFLLLSAKQISEPLSAEEQAELDGHLASCPTCRSIVAGMRRDDIFLRAELVPAKVSPRVRRRVLDEAAGRRRIDPRLVLGLAAALAVAAIGVPLLAGGRVVGDPSLSVPTPSAAVSAPSTPPAQTASSSPSLSVASPSAPAPEVSPSPSTSGPFVLGNYVYGTTAPRRDTLAARFFGGDPTGEWSRRTPATGDSSIFYGGPVTCLEISGSDAWLAGPATTATDGTADRAAFIHVTDGGPDGEGDTAFLWLTTPGQTIVTMTDWCEKRFIPAEGLPLTTGDVLIRDEP
jgi:hypothetical protein